MELNLDFSTYTLWSLYATIAFFILAILGFIFKWGFRFRFVGATGFMIVLTTGLFALSLGLSNRVEVEGALRFNLVYDTGGNRAVITVPAEITPSELDATLQQAAIDLFSYGRNASNGDTKLTIRARTQVHEDDFTYPIYLGQVRRSLFERADKGEITIFNKEFARLNSFSQR